ncbi:MAG: shikimate dehydrogenase family protein [Paludibacteraceae bacterium]
MKNFGLIGYPLGHSFSKKYFSKKFEKENIDAKYELYEISEIEKIKEIAQNIDLTGLNVTIPYKQSVIPFLTELDETADKIGAVNVIHFIKTNSKPILKGYNTDVIGFTNSIKNHLKPHHSKALILGTGGAAKAMAYGLQKLGLKVTFVTRNTQKIKQQADKTLSIVKPQIISYDELNRVNLTENQIIVNASPIGTFPKIDECPAIPYQFLTPGHLLFDAVYNPSETLFMKKGKEKGADVLNGEQMLIGQAEAAWKIWSAK